MAIALRLLTFQAFNQFIKTGNAMSAAIENQMFIDHELPTQKAIKRLIEPVGGVRASFYLHVNYTPSEAKKPATRLKNEVKAAEDALKTRGMNEENIDHWLAPAKEMVEDPSMLGQHPDSLALFLAEDHGIMMNVPDRVENTLTISNRFFLKPLLPLLNDGGVIYLLALDREDTRMYRRGLNGLERVKVPDMPSSIHQSSAFDDPEDSLQRHSSGQNPTGNEPETTVHGQGSSKEYRNKRNHEFNHEVGTSISRFLSGSGHTLVILGDEHNIGLVDQSLSLDGQQVIRVKCNPSEFTDDALWERTNEVAADLANASVNRAIEKLQEARRDQIIKSAEDAAIAASHGMIRRCIVASDSELLGVNLPEYQTVETLSNGHGNDCAHDLLDVIAQETIRHGGEAFVVERNRIPGDTPVFAQRRF